MSIHIDEFAVDDPGAVLAKLLDLIATTLQPIYGIGYSMPYYWGPNTFDQGLIASRYATEDRTFYGAPPEIGRRSRAFSRTFLANASERRLDVRMRDIFELNLLSEGHLAQPINGTTLKDFIQRQRIGRLNQLTPVTWQWNVPLADIEPVRRALNDADFIIVKG
ncbi:hypothetical protein [Sinorhizobium fredii]|nr:hypothetical protein [Sinorhizobium fredii]